MTKTVISVNNKEVNVTVSAIDLRQFLQYKESQCSYLVNGYQYTQEYKRGWWDGKINLYKRKRGTTNVFTAPCGVLYTLLEEFPHAEVIDNRRTAKNAKFMRLNNKVIKVLRDYQLAAVEEVIADCGLITGKGLLRLPTRSGKTVISASIITRLGYTTMFVVNSEMLLDQTVRFFNKVIQCDDHDDHEPPLIGQWGAGVYEAGWITVASVQSLTKHFSLPHTEQKYKAVKKMLDTTDIMFFDECHHLEGDAWRRIMTESNAMYKIGLSATIFFDSKEGSPSGSIWLYACTGPIMYSLTTSKLIDAGWLCTPTICMHLIPRHTARIMSAKYAAAYRDGIVCNDFRNEKIVAICEEEKEQGCLTLITCRQIKHVKSVCKILMTKDIKFAVIIGSTKSEERRQIISDFSKHVYDVVIGTVFGEAVDLPFLDTVIVAGGMCSKVLTLQRLRNLTPVDHSGSTLHEPLSTPQHVRVHDFIDLTNNTLLEHSEKREEIYRSNRAFNVRKEGDYE